MRVLLLLLACLSVFSHSVLVKAQGESGQKLAVLIGVDEYTRLPDLRYARRDIEAVRDQLYRIGFSKENVFCLTGGGNAKEVPIKANIEPVLRTVLDLAEEGDTIFVAMCGHGVELGGKPYFCPMDANDRDLLGTTISLDDLFGTLQDCRATFKLMVIDACRDNPLRGRSIADTTMFQTIANPPEGIVLLQSCARDEMSYEDDEFQHGIFSYYLVDGLKGAADANKDGKITLMELYAYIADKTKRRALSEYRAVQRPYIKGEISDFVMADISEIIVPDMVLNLQAAIDQCPKDGTVKIRPGTYSISKTLTFDKTINIQGMGEEPKDCVLQLNGSPKGVHISSGEPTFRNITFRAPEAKLAEATAVFVEASEVLFEHCVFSGSNNALEVCNNGKVNARHCDFHGSAIGVYIGDAGEGDFDGCRFFRNQAVGLEVSGGDLKGNVHVKKCQFFDNKSNGIHLCQKSQGILEQCDVFRNGIDTISPQVAICSIEGVTLLKCKIYDMNGGNGLFVNETGVAIVQECEIYNIRNNRSENADGVGIDVAGRITAVKCKIHDCENIGIQVEESGQAVFQENQLRRNGKNWDIAKADSVERISNDPNE